MHKVHNVPVIFLTFAVAPTLAHKPFRYQHASAIVIAPALARLVVVFHKAGEAQGITAFFMRRDVADGRRIDSSGHRKADWFC